MVLAAKIHHFWRPESVAGAVGLELQAARDAAIIPGRAAVRSRGDADVGTVDPLDAFLVVGISAAVGIEHPPAFLSAVPDQSGINGTVVDRVAEKWRRSFANGVRQGGPRISGVAKLGAQQRDRAGRDVVPCH